MSDLDENLERKLALTWPSEADREMARRVLATYGTADHEREAVRVRLAIVMLSRGSLDELRNLTAAAKVDYRDVLMWAEYPEESRAAWTLEPELSADQQRELSEMRRRDRQQYEDWRKK
jgi:hypothetical protein